MRLTQILDFINREDITGLNYSHLTITKDKISIRKRIRRERKKIANLWHRSQLLQINYIILNLKNVGANLKGGEMEEEYEVTIKEIEVYKIMIKANSPEEAEEKAEDIFDAEDVDKHKYHDYSEVEIEVF